MAWCLVGKRDPARRARLGAEQHVTRGHVDQLETRRYGVRASGGSIDVGGPAIANGVVATTSGYGQWGGMRGNVLLAFSVDGR